MGLIALAGPMVSFTCSLHGLLLTLNVASVVIYGGSTFLLLMGLIFYGCLITRPIESPKIPLLLMRYRLLTWILFAMALGIIMQPWLSPAAPLTVNSENIPEINYIWLLRNLIEEGHGLTAWHPKALGGESVSTHLFYPFYWSVALISSLTTLTPETLYKALVFLDLWLGCVVMAEFLRRLTGQPAAGLVAGLIFGLIPGHMNTIEGFYIKISWLAVPLVFWLYERGFGLKPSTSLIEVRSPVPPSSPQRVTFRDAIYLGLALSLMGLASIQIPLMMSLILPPYLLYREWAASRLQQRTAWLIERSRAWLIVGGVALGVVAAYYLPTLIELEQLSFTRFASFNSTGTVDLSFLVTMLTARWSATFSPTNYHEVTWYLGDVALLLALIGALSQPTTSPRGLRFFFIGAGLLSLLLLVGHSLGPIPNLIYQAVERLPLINGALRHSFRWVLPLSFCLAVLAGLGTARITAALQPKVTFASVLLLIGLAGLITVDYYPLTASFRTTSAYLRDSERTAFTWLNQQEAGYRYFAPFANGTAHTYHLVYGHHLTNRPAVWDDQYLSHYVSRRAYTFFAGHNVQFPDLPSGLLDPLFIQMVNLGAVRHIILFLESYNHQDLYQTAIGLNVPVVFEQDEVRILLNRTAKPMMQLYPHMALYLGPPDDETSLSTWLPLLAPRGIALIDATTSGHLPTWAAQADYLLAAPEAVATSVDQTKLLESAQVDSLPNVGLLDAPLTWSRPAPDRAEVKVELGQPATLVFAEAWYPGWHVYVDGQAQPLLRANMLFQGVMLSSGSHTVHFEYRRPWYTWLGYGLTGATLLIVVIGLYRSQ